MDVLRPQTTSAMFKGILGFIPKTLSLMAVQRHSAASRSTRLAIREQQGLDCKGETTMPNKFCNREMQTRRLGQFDGGGDTAGGA